MDMMDISGYNIMTSTFITTMNEETGSDLTRNESDPATPVESPHALPHTPPLTPSSLDLTPLEQVSADTGLTALDSLTPSVSQQSEGNEMEAHPSPDPPSLAEQDLSLSGYSSVVGEIDPLLAQPVGRRHSLRVAGKRRVDYTEYSDEEFISE